MFLSLASRSCERTSSYFWSKNSTDFFSSIKFVAKPITLWHSNENRSITTRRTRLSVITCRYRKTNSRARSLSTLIAEDARIDIIHKLKVNAPKRPLTARNLNKSVVGGWKVSLRRLTGIRALPSDAVMVIRMCTTEKSAIIPFGHVNWLFFSTRLCSVDLQ